MTITRSVGIAGALLFALVAASCSETGDTTVQGPDTGATGISVTGEGEAEGPPDTGFFAVGVAVTALTVAEARERVATAASAVIGSVKANGVADRDVQTIEVNIYPNYEYTKPEAPRLTGYTMTNTVSVKVRDIATFSKVIDDALVAGGDSVRLNGLSFGIEDTARLAEVARKKAMEDARNKGEQLAALAGATLGKPLSVNESYYAQPYEFALRAYPVPPATGGGTPIEPGTGKVVITVNVRWEMVVPETGG